MKSDAQYAEEKHLATRIAFHENYTVPYLDFSKWVFDQIPFAPNQRVLELGCGNGDFWVRNADRLPEGLRLTLTDLSQGMVETTSSRLSEIGVKANFQITSAQALPFEENAFDIIIAKHMLYHVADRPSALAQIRSVLKPKGVFCALTNSSHYMQEIYSLLGHANSRWITGEASAFTTDNGAEQLTPFFETVEKKLLESKLRVTDARAVRDYIGSLATLFEKPEQILEAARLGQPKVIEAIEQEGAFSISKTSGLFLCN